MEKNLETLKCKTKNFFYKNKGKIKKCARVVISIIVVGTETFLIIENKRKDKMIISLNQENEYLRNLCKRKDSFMCSLISKLLRQGNSEGGRQMVYRRQWLNQNRELVR